MTRERRYPNRQRSIAPSELSTEPSSGGTSAFYPYGDGDHLTLSAEFATCCLRYFCNIFPKSIVTAKT